MEGKINKKNEEKGKTKGGNQGHTFMQKTNKSSHKMTLS